MHRRESSGSTVRVAGNGYKLTTSETTLAPLPVKATLWTHTDSFSPEEVLISPSVASELCMRDGDLIEILPDVENIGVRDFQGETPGSVYNDGESVSELDLDDATVDSTSRYLCIAKVASNELMEKNKGLEISMTKTAADAFNFHSRIQVCITKSDVGKWAASHIEISFRDAYLARSDMWRMVSQELAGRTVYKGQKLSFLGSMKLTIKSIHIRGHHVSTGYFSKSTIPVFRSEAARFVVFIQMSREMWDFDSEGNGEIMFNRVINGFLPDLFRRWVALEVRHLVSIILFGRLEYDRYDLGHPQPLSGNISQSSSASNINTSHHQDFYRVVVTDMASAQWTTILDELKRDFRVFLREMSLHSPPSEQHNSQVDPLPPPPPKITGRPSTALKGNILEAINIASSQFANDYIDRDLIRTGISTIVITAGTGVFDVDRDLLNLTSDNLTNNGIGIDIVCLSKMPLHSVPLFRYPLTKVTTLSRVSSNVSASPQAPVPGITQHSLPSFGYSPSYSSFTSTSATYFSRFSSADPLKASQKYGFGVPQWIDLSYWSPENESVASRAKKKRTGINEKIYTYTKRPFVPRVRMYELQMMGLMELGMADMAIPYISETSGRQHKKRTRLHSDVANVTSAGSLSQSPTFLRKGQHNTPRYRQSQVLPSLRNRSPSHKPEYMEAYDTSLFRSVVKQGSKSKEKVTKAKDRNQSGDTQPTTNKPKAISQHKKSPSRSSSGSVEDSSHSTIKKPPHDRGSNAAPPKAVRPPRISRNLSYALRGLAPPLRAIASTEVNVENVKAQPLHAKTSLMQATLTHATHANSSESIRNLESDRGSFHGTDVDTRSIMSADTALERPTKPISISSSATYRPSELRMSVKGRAATRLVAKVNTTSKDSGRSSVSSSPSSSDDLIGSLQSLDMMPDSIPRSNLPFIRNVNASNPLKKHPDAGSVFGRWQHLYPQKPRSSTVKWRSLCTPASVPLTTEEFPSLKDLDTDYDSKQHTVSIKNTNEMLEEPVTIEILLREMVALRLAHGYQIVTGYNIARATGDGFCDASVFLSSQPICNQGDYLFMYMGNTIQKLSFASQEYVHVTKYVRKIPQMADPFPRTVHYSPNIKTILSDEYLSRPMTLRGVSEEYPWAIADDYLAAAGLDQDEKVDELRFWRARFVLLPVEPPAHAYRPSQHHSEDNEEEIHLLGIRALAQMWQRNRFVAYKEKKVASGRMGTIRRRDQNPLEIKFETLNPSEVVATELDKLLALEEGGEVQTTQLLPETEKLDRDSPMTRLSQSMQGEKGIEIKNRRWHFRLHYNCFQGEEFTNWLLHNVKNMETREESVEFGNQLMKEGLFEHVSSRHKFRDGNYFYSLKPEFKLTKLDLKGSWLTTGRRSDKSVPPTPLSEHPSKEQPMMTTRSRSGSSLAFQLNPSTPVDASKQLIDKRKKTVSLSKMIKIDVDPRKRSNRTEIVNLHYDRLHNPENCYHIELSWLNVTSKLVDDAIVSWTTQAEKYGLKLVEVPIAEASEVVNKEPFRSIYRIKLAREPPKRAPATNVFTTSSFTPQPNPLPDIHMYQKALLRRFNFVLDLEAVSEYPENVDIQYSWGRLEYRYTQFVHRSGIILAQIATNGDILLLANRLYNSRLTSTKDTMSKFDTKKDTSQFLYRPSLPSQAPSTVTIQPQMQASGIIAPNMQSPTLSPFSPQIQAQARASADILGSKAALTSSTIAQFVTPEQIKDDLESFCKDPARLDSFYREITLIQPPHAAGSTSSDRRRPNGSTSSSLLRPIREPDLPGLTGGDNGIPGLELPESITSPGPSTNNSGFSMGFSMLRRARGSVMYDSVAEMFSSAAARDKDGGSPSRSGSTNGEGDREASGSGSGKREGNAGDDVTRSPRIFSGANSPRWRSVGS